MLFSLTSNRSDGLPPTAAPRTPRRRRIGLALGAGSARGWAHIGVLRELAEHGIVPDVVAGTSIGAVVGGAYAAGKLDKLETFARSLNRRRVFTLMDVSFAGTGLITGARLKRRLNRDLAGLSIERLSTPFAAVAAEMSTGHEVWLTEGDLVEAVRASYALPGIFEPLQIEGRWLFDGALVNPVPVSVCRSLGADVVIAVNLTADISKRVSSGQVQNTPRSVGSIEPAFEALVTAMTAEPATMYEPSTKRRRLFPRRRMVMKREDGAPSIAGVLADAFNISQDRISRSRLAADPPDIMINARLTTCGSFDFHKAADLIEHGRGVARRAIPDIEALLAATVSPESGAN